MSNLTTASDELLAGLCRQQRHIMFEHDVRICYYRGNFPGSADKVHRFAQRCVCAARHWRCLFRSALGTIYLTHRQLGVYAANPFFELGPSIVLGSSLMSRRFFQRAAQQRARAHAAAPSEQTVVVWSKNEIKGFARSKAYCEARGILPLVIRAMPHADVLDTLAQSHRLVYLPNGLEPAGRLLVEARMLGCEVISNDHSGVCGESWWHLPNEMALRVLQDAPHRFWRSVARFASQRPAATAPHLAGCYDARYIKKQRARFAKHVERLASWQEYLPNALFRGSRAVVARRSAARVVSNTDTDEAASWGRELGPQQATGVVA
ncbi:MAG TPA: hypothetical protein ENK23_07330 [Sorangium sp.]|nr:hypothetical protein [Sorangium sp.]